MPPGYTVHDTVPTPTLIPLAVDVAFDDAAVVVALADGRRVSVPLAWFPRLLHATPEQRATWYFSNNGEGIHWPDVDEDILVRNLLAV